MSASTPPILQYAPPKPPRPVSVSQAAFLIVVVPAAAFVNYLAIQSDPFHWIAALFWLDVLIAAGVPLVLRLIKGPSFHWLLALVFSLAMLGVAFASAYIAAEFGGSC